MKKFMVISTLSNVSGPLLMAFKISTRARYSLRLMLEIAKVSEDSKHIDLGSISQNTKISRRYLEQLVILLKNASLVKSVAGRHGGYTLSKSADQITLGDIVEATIGQVAITDCTMNPEVCENSSTCQSRLVWLLINDQIRQILFGLTLAQLNNCEHKEQLLQNILLLQSASNNGIQGDILEQDKNCLTNSSSVQ
ncbi:RrF2 family transcriptional regulator [candidate division CSSED10-310 bacterium]|uniref:RrF2 family transcriptional regulator n=1 Tax=candidate division CSSED10-310 bacterium TaxID=2855610 RepID=A0ABV6Z2W6_UNCC1